MSHRVPHVLILLLAAAVCSAQNEPAPPPPLIWIGPPGLPVDQRPILIRPRIIDLNGGPPPSAATSTLEPVDRRAPFHTDIEGPADLAPLIAALRSARMGERTAATDTLLRLLPKRLPEIRSALERETDAEAAARLAQVATHLHLKNYTPLQGTSSLLGITLSFELLHPDPAAPDIQRMSVAVTSLQPGYPAAQELRVGDRLLAIAGKPFPATFDIDDFRSSISLRSPGSVVPFTLLRGGQEIELAVQVAGIPDGGNIDVVIARRNQVLKEFEESLHSAADAKPLIVQEKTQEDPTRLPEPGEVFVPRIRLIPGQ